VTALLQYGCGSVVVRFVVLLSDLGEVRRVRPRWSTRRRWSILFRNMSVMWHYSRCGDALLVQLRNAMLGRDGRERMSDGKISFEKCLWLGEFCVAMLYLLF